MTAQEAREITFAAFKNGTLELVPPKPNILDEDYQRKISNNRIRYRKNRIKFLAEGKTAHGTKRHYFRTDLTGWTPEQKRARRLEKKREYNKTYERRTTKNT